MNAGELSARWVSVRERRAGVRARVHVAAAGLARGAARVLAVAPLVGVLLWTTVTRWHLVAEARFAGRADAAFYFDLARRLRAGSWDIHYVWHFRGPPGAVAHFGPDHWLPLPSLAMAAATLGSGASLLHAALQATVLAGAAHALAVAVLAARLGAPGWAACLAGVVPLIAPASSRFFVQCDSSPWHALLATAAIGLAAAPRGRADLAVAGLALGLAQLCRNDTVVVTLVVVTLLLRAPSRAALPFLAGFGAVVAPFVALALARTGTAPLGGGIAWVVHYEDLFSWPPHPTASDMLALGWERNAQLRYDAAVDRLARLATDVDALVFVVGVGLAGAVLARPRDPGPAPGAVTPGGCVAIALCVVVAHAVVTPVSSVAGSLSRSTPFVLGLAAAAGATLARGASLRGRAAATALTALLLLAPLRAVAATGRKHVERNNQYGQAQRRLGEVLRAERRCLGRRPVVMARDVWELALYTDFPAVQIPNERLAVILEVAARYGVTHLVPSPRRSALRDAAALTAAGGPFLDVGGGVWRLRSAGEQRCGKAR